MITVIIPALNEAATIGAVVSFALRDPRVSEVIVVDDGSIDGTESAAAAAGATVITSSLLGKGASMEDGLAAASRDIVLYLDGDLAGLHPDLIGRMAEPLIAGEADFVKARFTRTAGRVTQLTARPLLQSFFPELCHFSQPLGGVIAARRATLQGQTFENDYGVDIGLLIDVVVGGARVVEVDIGHVEHDSHPLDELGEMAKQVARAILDRAHKYHRLRAAQIREVAESERIARANLPTVFGRIENSERLALFDMDGVLLDGRFIVSLAERTGRSAELAELLDHAVLPDAERTARIGKLFTGVPASTFIAAARSVPLDPNAIETVVGLRKLGYRVGIVSDSYFIATEIVRRRVFADFSVANLMRFRGGYATGNVLMGPAYVHPEGCTRHEHCKANVMYHLMEHAGLTPSHVLAVGDGLNDVCMLEAAGTSVAYRPKRPEVERAATDVERDDLRRVMDVARASSGRRRSTAARTRRSH
jgi:HAD superfamily phosphoserine phosphatase-like hydrolase